MFFGCHWLLVSQCERITTVELEHDALTMHSFSVAHNPLE